MVMKQITISTYPVYFTNEPSDSLVVEGSNVSVTCSVLSESDESVDVGIIWFKDDELFKDMESLETQPKLVCNK